VKHQATPSSAFGPRSYLIKWKGYESAANTWQSAEDLQNCPVLLNNYMKKHRLLPEPRTKHPLVLRKVVTSPPKLSKNKSAHRNHKTVQKGRARGNGKMLTRATGRDANEESRGPVSAASSSRVSRQRNGEPSVLQAAHQQKSPNRIPKRQKRGLLRFFAEFSRHR
jgi:hypothetical protein